MTFSPRKYSLGNLWASRTLKSRRRAQRWAPVASNVEVLEDRLLLFVLTGAQWPGTTITYSYDNLLDGNLGGNLTAEQLKAAVEEAFTLWSTYAPLHFVEQIDSGPAVGTGSYTPAGHPTIRIGHGPGDGAGPNLASAYPPGTGGLAGDIIMETGVNWTLHPSQDYDFLDIIVHEIGHSLGLDHQPPVGQGGEDAMMNPNYGGVYNGLGTAFLFQDDIDGIRYLYGIGTGSVTPLAPGDGDDHSNSAIGATVVNVDSTAVGTIDVGGDEDWFQFTAFAGTQYAFQTSLTSLTDTTLRLYGQDGVTSLAFDDDGGEGRASLINWTAPASGTYFVRVKAFSDLDTGGYNLDVIHNDDFGGSASTSTQLSINVAQNGAIAVAGDQDWFSMDVVAGQTYRVLLDAQSLPHGRLTLYSSNGSTALLSGDGQGAGTDPWLIWKAEATETVFVSVKGNTTETGSYSISYTAVDGLLASTPGTNSVALVRVFNASNQVELFNFVAYGAFTGGAHVALGDVNGDGIADVITGANAGGGPHVRVVSGANGDNLMNFYAYTPLFTGGVRVGAADVDGDGKDEIITATGPGGGPHVRVFDAMTGTQIYEFFAYDPTYIGGVNVAAADVNNDGKADIITAPSAGMAPQVKVFSGSDGTTLLHSFNAYVSQFHGGVFVAGGDVNDDGYADIITGAGPGGGPHVRVFSGTNAAEIYGVLAYTPLFTGGVRVGAADVNDDGHADVITGAGPGGGPHVRVFNGDGFAVIEELYAYTSFTYGVFIAGAPAAMPGSGSSPIMDVRGSSFESGPAESIRPLELSMFERSVVISSEAAPLGRADSASVRLVDTEEEDETDVPGPEADEAPASTGESVEGNPLPNLDWAEVFSDSLFNQLTA